MKTSLPIAALLLIACESADPPAGTPDPAGTSDTAGTPDPAGTWDTGWSTDGTATYACRYVYRFPDREETGDYVDHVLDCETYASTGWQIVQDDVGNCEAAGLSAGASSASCTCEWVLSEECNPGAVND